MQLLVLNFVLDGAGADYLLAQCEKMKYLYFLLLVMLVGCARMNLVQLIQDGEVNISNSVTKVPFTYRAGLINLKVVIEGQIYNFLFDTGAPLLVSTEIFNKHGLKNKFSNKVRDSGGKTEELMFTKVPKLTIESAEFLNFGSAVQDMENSEVFKCLDFDGIIGANLFRELHLEINYKEQYLLLTKNWNLFDIPESVTKTDFTTNISSTPLIDINIEGEMIENITFDTGSNGSLKISNTEISNQMEQRNKKDGLYAYGFLSYGIHGKQGNDTICRRKVDYIEIAGQKYEKTNVLFQSKKDILGNEFLKNFRIFINWPKKEMYLYQHEIFEDKAYYYHGFKLVYLNEEYFISKLYVDSEASQKGMKLGDKILSINGISYTQIPQSDFCHKFINEIDFDYEDESQVKILVLRENKEIEFILNQQTY